MKSSEDEYKEELTNQIKRTKEIIDRLDITTKRLSSLWFIAVYVAVLMSIMLIKIIWW